jgi:hypothetical protein
VSLCGFRGYADDDGRIQKFVAAQPGGCGYRVIIASTGCEALADLPSVKMISYVQNVPYQGTLGT